jgi:hypothetical protein
MMSVLAGQQPARLSRPSRPDTRSNGVAAPKNEEGRSAVENSISALDRDGGI